MRFATSAPRSCGLALALALAHAACNAWAQSPAVRMVVQSSPLAGFRHHEAAAVWEQMRIGDRLDLRREPDNAWDPNAIRVEWRGRKLGYVPRRDNDALAWGLDRGDALRARISRLDVARPAYKRLEFEVYVE